MPDLQEVYRMATEKVAADPGAMERQLRAQRRAATNRRMGAFALVAALIIAGLMIAFATIPVGDDGSVPATNPPGTGAATRVDVRKAEVVALDGSIASASFPDLPDDAYGVTLSPDGGTIAYAQTNKVMSWGEKLKVVSDGGTTNVLPGYLCGMRPAWSPDGSRIAFMGNRCGVEPGDIYVVDADGGNLKRLTSDPDWSDMATWSPDGTTIAYVDNGSPDRSRWKHARIKTVSVDGGRPSVVPVQEAADAPAYSPDGSSIVYTFEGHLWIAGIDGTGAREVVSDPCCSAVPRWSPDGSRIAFLTDSDTWRVDVDLLGYVDRVDAMGLRVLDVASGEVSTVGRVHAFEGGPDWLPSSDAVFVYRAQQA